MNKPSRFTVGAEINPIYRKSGLGTEFYKKLGAISKKFGGKTFVGSTFNKDAIKKLRNKIGKTRQIAKPDSYGAFTHVTKIKKPKGKK